MKITAGSKLRMNTGTEVKNSMSRLSKPEDDQLLQLLQAELKFLDAGGYGRTFRSQWRPTLLLRDSPACLNYGGIGRQNPCEECPLFSLVAPEKKVMLVPCHFIPLNKSGVTIAELYAKASQESLDQLYRKWLQDMTHKLERS